MGTIVAIMVIAVPIYNYQTLQAQASDGCDTLCCADMQATQHGGDDYNRIVRGDPGIESIYNWTSAGPTVAFRGATGKGDGVHILTGHSPAHMIDISSLPHFYYLIVTAPPCITQLKCKLGPPGIQQNHTYVHLEYHLPCACSLQEQVFTSKASC